MVVADDSWISRRRWLSLSAITGREAPSDSFRSSVPRSRSAMAPERWCASASGPMISGIDHIGIEFRVVVEDHVAIRTSVGKGLAELLHDPLGGRLSGDVEMQDARARAR